VATISKGFWHSKTSREIMIYFKPVWKAFFHLIFFLRHILGFLDILSDIYTFFDRFLDLLTQKFWDTSYTARKTRPFPKSFFYHQKTFTRLKSSSRRFFFILTTFSKLEIFLTKLISEVSKYGILAEKTTCSLLEWPSYIFLGMLRTLALFRNKKKVVA